MKKIALAAVVTGFLLVAGAAPQGPSEAPVLVFTHVNVIDGVSDQPLREATVVVRDGRIASVGTGSVNAPAGATVFDLKGRWMLPGFVDAHVHVGDLAAARRALVSGATTVRSMGVSHFVDVGLRELHRGGNADLPDVIAAGYHIRPNLAEGLFLDFPKMNGLAPVAGGADNLRALVRAMVSRGADVIKVLATERAGLPDTDPRKRVFTDDELAALVDEARKAGVPVAAHAHGDEGAAAAVRAGVRTIEHGTYLSTATLTMMNDRGVCLDPTIATVEDLIYPGGDYDNSTLSIRGRSMLPRVRETSENARKLGVKLIAGTDTGYGPASNRRMAHEVAEMARVGMSPMEAIKAGTSVSADCLGIVNRTGAIRPGLEADLIVIDRDPLADISVLGDVLMVVNNGRLAINRIVW